MAEMQRWWRGGGEERRGGRCKHIYTPAGEALTEGEGRREALKGIRVEVCWRGRLFGTSDMSQWGPGTGQSNYRHWWHRAAGGGGGVGVGGLRRQKRLLSDCHLGVRTKRFGLQPQKSESGNV